MPNEPKYINQNYSALLSTVSVYLDVTKYQWEIPLESNYSICGMFYKCLKQLIHFKDLTYIERTQILVTKLETHLQTYSLELMVTDQGITIRK